jgi:hypothetical protein
MLVVAFLERRRATYRDIIEYGGARCNFSCKLLSLSNLSWPHCAYCIVVQFHAEMTISVNMNAE